MNQSSQAPASNADPSLIRQQQTSFPAHDPQPYDGPPKVDAGDSGASVGGNPNLSAVTAALEDQISGEQAQGYRGFNPDPRPNEDYTVAGVTSSTSTNSNDTPSTFTTDASSEALLARLQGQ